jgi:uncharacterized protein (TIGR03000 family)
VYTTVLVMTLMGSAEVPAQHHRHGGGCCGYTNPPMQGGGCCGYTNPPMQGGGCCGYTNPPMQGGGCCGYTNPPMQGGGRRGYTNLAMQGGRYSATISVTLPADAKLTFDGSATTSTSESRRFVSPELTPGWNYHYTLRAEITRDGQKLVEEQVITVRAGQHTRVTMEFARPAVAKR